YLRDQFTRGKIRFANEHKIRFQQAVDDVPKGNELRVVTETELYSRMGQRLLKQRFKNFSARAGSNRGAYDEKVTLLPSFGQDLDDRFKRCDQQVVAETAVGQTRRWQNKKRGIGFEYRLLEIVSSRKARTGQFDSFL